MKAACIAAALLVLVVTPRGAAGESCSLGWVCVEPRVNGDTTDLIAVNLKPWPLTLSVRADTQNLDARPADEVSVTLGAKESRTVISMQVIEDQVRSRYSYRFDWTVGNLEALHDDSVVYQLPFASGESWTVLQGYGSRLSHTGLERYTVDFDMPIGTPVLAARNGHDRSILLLGCFAYLAADFQQFTVGRRWGCASRQFPVEIPVVIHTDREHREGDVVVV